jgi:hypothetical protein
MTILAQYQETVVLLTSLYRELATVRADEILMRAEVYQSSPNSSPSGRELDAKHAAASHTASAITLEGEIRAQELTLRYLDQLLAHVQH